MKNFLKKRNDKKAFTLAELLIVVAIIGVLVAVSIPIFSTQLEKSRENTDIANMRAAKAAAIACYLDCNEAAGTYWYDAEQGALITSAKEKAAMYNKGEYCKAHVLGDAEVVKTYGKGNTKDGGCEDFKLSTNPTDNTYYKGDSDVKYGIIKVVITSNEASPESSTSSSVADEGVSDYVTMTWHRDASPTKTSTEVTGAEIDALPQCLPKSAS